MPNKVEKPNKPAVAQNPSAGGAAKRQITGVVVSTKMKDTTVIEVKRYMKHAKYHKFMKRSTKLLAHDPGNTKKEGEMATIEACRPISKRKAYKVVA